MSYTDEQLHTVLVNECQYEKQFPNTHEDGWEHEKACKAYADDLTSARDQELADPKGCGTCGYKAFCTNYYQHKGGSIDGKKVKEEEPEKKEKKEEMKLQPPIPDVDVTKTKKDAVADSAQATQASWMPFFLIFILVIVGISLCYLKSSRSGVQ